MNDERGTSDAGASSDLRLRTRAFAIRIVRPLYVVAESRRSSGFRKTITQKRNLGWCSLSRSDKIEVKCGIHKQARVGAARIGRVHYWLNLLIDCGIVKKEKLSGLCQEANELAAIFVASVKTVKRRR